MSTDGSNNTPQSGPAGPVPHDPAATAAGATSAGTTDGTATYGTDGPATYGTDGTAVQAGAPYGTGPQGIDGTTTDGTITDGTGSGEPGWVARNTNALISALLVVIVAALAIAAVVLYRNHRDDANADTATAATAFISGQGGQVETIECTGDTCAAVVGGQAYTVLVQEDDNGDQHFGISPYTH